MQNRLEEYLDEVSRPMPASERVEWRSEAEQHLTALVAAYEELGHSPEAATELALEKFGDAQRLGRQMEAESPTALPLPLKGVAALFALQGLMCWTLSVPRFLRHDGQNEALLVWGAPALFIAAGLVLRKPFWRSVALSLLCLTLFFTTPMIFLAERWIQNTPWWLAVFRIFAYTVVPAWQLWVLTRPRVKALFRKKTPKKRTWAS